MRPTVAVMLQQKGPFAYDQCVRFRAEKGVRIIRQVVAAGKRGATRTNTNPTTERCHRGDNFVGRLSQGTEPGSPEVPWRWHMGTAKLGKIRLPGFPRCHVIRLNDIRRGNLSHDLAAYSRRNSVSTSFIVRPLAAAFDLTARCSSLGTSKLTRTVTTGSTALCAAATCGATGAGAALATASCLMDGVFISNHFFLNEFIQNRPNVFGCF